MNKVYGPTLPISEELHAQKYRGEGESFEEGVIRGAGAVADDEAHYAKVVDINKNMRFLPAGRVQAAMGSARNVTPYNCFVSSTIEDSMDSIMRAATEAAETMRLGGGIGYDFSRLRPEGDRIVSLDSTSSGPISFMEIFDAICGTIMAAGHRRGAQMAVLRVDHPDIEKFIRAKQNEEKFKRFNVSVAVTDKFMQAAIDGDDFDLVFDGRVYGRVNASALLDEIMRSTWNWAEPGVLFIDRINEMNNLYYCEELAATNPCGEQPLPPNGACLLGSFNLTMYIKEDNNGKRYFDYGAFENDIAPTVRAMDNVVDRAVYPLPSQQLEAESKRRMGLGVTGLANAGESLGLPYGTPRFIKFTESVLSILANTAYMASAMLAKEKGAFPLYDKEKYLAGAFIKTLDDSVQKAIAKHGIRNSHLTSIAPTGTISLTANNVSSGGEPVFALKYDRTINTLRGVVVESVTDYAFREWGVRGRTASELSADDHLRVLVAMQKYVDSAVSKTCNVSPDMPFDEFKMLYINAWKGKCKGITTYNPEGNRKGVLNVTEESEGAACWINPDGSKSCE
jgi:ribonucleoside-diphosphate reductase alpha chain